MVDSSVRAATVHESDSVQGDRIRRRLHWLILAAVDGGASHSAADAWLAWRSELADFDDVSGGELALLPYAWSRAEAAGATDADAPRIAGLRRRHFLVHASTLAAIRQLQSRLLSSGIQTVVSGGTAAMLAYPALSRPGHVVAELYSSPKDRDALARQRPRLINGLIGRAVFELPTVLGSRPVDASPTTAVVRWRREDLSATSDSLLRSEWVEWQGESFRLLAADDLAYSLLLSHFLRHRQGSRVLPLWVVDLGTLAGSPGFDVDRFMRLVRESGMRRLFRTQALSASEYLSPGLLECLTSRSSRRRMVDVRRAKPVIGTITEAGTRFRPLREFGAAAYVPLYRAAHALKKDLRANV